MTRREAEQCLLDAKQKVAMLLSSAPDNLAMAKVADNILALAKLKVHNELPEDERFSEETEATLSLFITQDAEMLKLKAKVSRLQGVPDPILIVGESGTGKEILAKALHGDRIGKFIAINCAGLPKELMESELFGHVKGAFTGADMDKIGLIEAAANGTLFLDEIGEMPYEVQAKLLRFLQDGCIRKVGAINSMSHKVRIVAATHQPMNDMVNQHKFRLDLYARIACFELYTKPLRERRGDIKLVVDSLDKSGKVYGEISLATGRFDTATNDSTDIWQTNTFPFNVRSIQHIVRRWVVLGEVGC